MNHNIHVIRTSWTDGTPLYGVVLGKSAHSHRPLTHQGKRKRVRALFRKPETLNAILPGLRYLSRKRAPLHKLADYLAQGVAWAETKETP